MRVLSLLILSIFLFSGCLSAPVNNSANDTATVSDNPLDGKTVQFRAEDGVALVGTLWKNETSTKPPVVLVHQLSRDRHSLDNLAQFLFTHGFTVLSYDLRGHGDSTRKDGQQISFVNFTDADYQFLPIDIWSARTFLDVNQIIVAGASIGANAALVFASQDGTSPGIVLLSPGINYHGLDITNPSKQGKVPMLVVASKEDTYSAQTAQAIFATGPLVDKKLIMLENTGHGADMLRAAPELSQTILDWLNEHLPA